MYAPLPCAHGTEVEAKGETDRLSLEELQCLVTKQELVKITQPHAPSQALAFWLPEKEMLEMEVGAEVRLKTLGDGPFVCECSRPIRSTLALSTLSPAMVLGGLELASPQLSLVWSGRRPPGTEGFSPSFRFHSFKKHFPFVVSLAKLDAGTVTKCNFAGDQQAGATWTDNIFAKKDGGRPMAESRGPGDGAEDAEWVCWSLSGEPEGLCTKVGKPASLYYNYAPKMWG